MPQPQPPARTASGESSSGPSGCIIALFVLCLVLAMGGFWIYFYGKAFFATMGRDAIVEAIQDSSIPDAEKEEMVEVIDRVQEGVSRGEIDYQQLGRIGERLVAGPLVGAFLVMGAESQYVAPSDLDPAEKQEARRTLQRLVHGVFADAIADEALDHVLEPITMVDAADGERVLKSRASDAEVREFLSRAEAAADAAALPHDPEPIDFSEELRRVVEEVLDRPLETAVPAG